MTFYLNGEPTGDPQDIGALKTTSPITLIEVLRDSVDDCAECQFAYLSIYDYAVNATGAKFLHDVVQGGTGCLGSTYLE